jgi:glucose/mannose-6-phosphate isomerase
VPPLIVLERIGLFPGASGWVTMAVAQLRRRRDELVSDGNRAEVLARRIGRTFPLVYGGGDIGAVAAQRWKADFNENAKVPSFWHTVPELCHNEVCGWGQHGDLTRQVFTLVHLRHDEEHPQVMRRFDLVAALVDEVVGAIEEVRAEGDGALAQLLDLVMVGDFTSLYLAAQEGVDPGPIPVLDEIKAALARPASE